MRGLLLNYDCRIGGVLGYAGNFWQDALYRKNFEKRGVEARLYAPMVSGECISSSFYPCDL